jgi:hypothetical protein
MSSWAVEDVGPQWLVQCLVFTTTVERRSNDLGGVNTVDDHGPDLRFWVELRDLDS